MTHLYWNPLIVAWQQVQRTCSISDIEEVDIRVGALDCWKFSLIFITLAAGLATLDLAISLGLATSKPWF